MLTTEIEPSKAEDAIALKKAEKEKLILEKLQLVLSGKMSPEQYATEQAEKEVALEDEAFIDPMTGLLNRSGLYYEFDLKLRAKTRKLKSGQVNGPEGCFVMLDLDNLKKVNDDPQFGHPVGDALISYVGQTMKTTLRPSDLVARLGGDEFALILDGASIDQALGVTERLRQSLTENAGLFLPPGVHIAASIGITEMPKVTDSKQLTEPGFGNILLDQLYKQADGVLYQAKRNGKNQTIVFPSGQATQEIISKHK